LISPGFCALAIRGFWNLFSNFNREDSASSFELSFCYGIKNFLGVSQMDINRLNHRRCSAFNSIRRNIFVLALLIIVFSTVFQAVSAQQKNSTKESGNAPATQAIAQTVENLNINDLARAGVKNSAKMNKELLNYTYNLKKIRRTLNEFGKETDKEVGAYEAYPVRGAHVLVALARNGSLLPSRQMDAERRMAGRELEIASREDEKQKEREAAGQEPESYFSAGIVGKYRGKNGHVSINPTDFLMLCELTSPTLKKVADRDIIVFKFQPRADVKFPYAKSYMPKLVGEVWMDLQDQSLVRIEGWPSQKTLDESVPRRTMPVEPVLLYEQKRLQDGNWVPNFIRMNSEGDEALFNGLNWDVQFEFSEYKRFNTGVGDVKIDAKEKH
jgi:hypothetical protein